MAKKRKKSKKLLKGLRKPGYFLGGLIGGFLSKGQAKKDIKTATSEMEEKEALREQEKEGRQKLGITESAQRLTEGLGGTEVKRRQEEIEKTKAAAITAATKGGTRVDPFAAMKAGKDAEANLEQQQSQAVRTGLTTAAQQEQQDKQTMEQRSIADIAQAETQRLEGVEDVKAGQKNLQASREQIYGGIDAGLDLATGQLFGERGAVVKRGLKERMKQRAMKKKNEVPAEEPEVTPGEFSHEKNPIDLIKKDESGDKEKIGEMTGGEAIVPPKNVKQIRHLIREKDGDELVTLMDKLLTKWDKEAEENNKAEEQSADKGRVINPSVRKPRLPKFKFRSSLIK